MQLDTDFVVMNDCVGRSTLTDAQRDAYDALCRQTGHLLWRVLGSIREAADGSLPVYATYCRRCFKGGYVQGDYAR